ncbi:MAG: ribosome-associated translation inhibitor RaiA [Bacteroidales bacterium]|jgi:putative sigma-54 modulation protein|nr:ribosome-associated translation inhibitor RaiA [Bacteroidales bacterium]
MELKIQSVGFNASERLEMFVQKKVDKLKTVYDGVSNANVYLKLENTSEIENKVGEIRVDVKGTELFVKKQSKTFEESIDNCVDALKKQLTKYKEKLRD